MNKRIATLLFLTIWAVPCWADFSVHVSAMTNNIDVMGADFDDFRWSWNGEDDQTCYFNFTNGSGWADLSGYNIGAKISAEGTTYVDVRPASVTASTNSPYTIYFSVDRTNVPPASLYDMEVRVWQGSATNSARSVVKGQVRVVRSLYADTNTFPFAQAVTNLGDYITITQAVANYAQVGSVATNFTAVDSNGSNYVLFAAPNLTIGFDTNIANGDITAVGTTGGWLTANGTLDGTGTAGLVQIGLTTGALDAVFATDVALAAATSAVLTTLQAQITASNTALWTQSTGTFVTTIGSTGGWLAVDGTVDGTASVGEVTIGLSTGALDAVFATDAELATATSSVMTTVRAVIGTSNTALWVQSTNAFIDTVTATGSWLTVNGSINGTGTFGAITISANTNQFDSVYASDGQLITATNALWQGATNTFINAGGTLEMTGNLRMGGQDITGLDDLTATGTVTALQFAVSGTNGTAGTMRDGSIVAGGIITTIGDGAITNRLTDPAIVSLSSAVGSELVTNGVFTNSAHGWALTNAAFVSAGTYSNTITIAAGSTGTISPSNTVGNLTGAVYRVSYKVYSFGDSVTNLFEMGVRTNSKVSTAIETIAFDHPSETRGGLKITVQAGANYAVYVDDVSVKKISQGDLFTADRAYIAGELIVKETNILNAIAAAAIADVDTLDTVLGRGNYSTRKAQLGGLTIRAGVGITNGDSSLSMGSLSDALSATAFAGGYNAHGTNDYAFVWGGDVSPAGTYGYGSFAVHSTNGAWFAADVRPTASNTYDLGSATRSWRYIYADTFPQAVFSTASSASTNPANTEFVTAGWIRSLNMVGSQWYFTQSATNLAWVKTANFVALSTAVPGTIFSNSIGTLTSDTYVAGGIVTSTLGTLQSPITFEMFLARNGGNASSVLPVFPEVYYVYSGATNQLGDWPAEAQYVTSTDPTRKTWSVSFNVPSITGQVTVLAYLKAGTVSGTAAGIDIYGGGVYDSHMDIPGSTAESAATVAANLATHTNTTLASGAHGGEADTLATVVGRGANVATLQITNVGAAVNGVDVPQYQQIGDWAEFVAAANVDINSLVVTNVGRLYGGNIWVDFASGQLKIAGDIAVIELEALMLNDAAEQNALDWGSRQMISTNEGGGVTLDWGDNELKAVGTDLWTVDGTASNGSQIVNYQTMTSVLASVSEYESIFAYVTNASYELTHPILRPYAVTLSNVWGRCDNSTVTVSLVESAWGSTWRVYTTNDTFVLTTNGMTDASFVDATIAASNWWGLKIENYGAGATQAEVTVEFAR